MAMVTCIECGKEVSSEAKTCPHCGKKLKTNFFDKTKDQALSLSESAKISEKIGSAISSIKSDNESGGIKKLAKNKYVIGSAIIIFSIIALITIMRGHGAPGCNDSDVKALVLEIAGGEIKSSLLPQAFISAYAEMNPTLTGIRINEKNDKVKKCKCGATLALSNGKTLPIDYIAQFTEDGKLYVEVSGLNFLGLL